MTIIVFILKLLMKVVMLITNDKTNYLLAPDEALSWLKVDRITKLHLFLAILPAILVVIKVLPSISDYYSKQLAKNTIVIPLTIIVFIIPMVIISGFLIEKVLDNTQKSYYEYKKNL